MSASKPNTHQWKFVRIGGLDQVVLESGADLLNLKYLNQKLWVALSCPVKGLELDEKTLALIDTDNNGRIRAPEVLAAIDWMALRLKSLDDIVRPKDMLPISAINEQTAEGKAILASARQILTSFGKSESEGISVSDTADTKKIFANTRFNGDGVITAESTDDPTLRSAINDIIGVVGAEADRSGAPGISQAKVDQFFAEASAYLDWSAKGNTADVLVFGADTAAAYAAVKAVRAKVDDYFARCSLANFDPRSLNALNRQESEYLVVASKDLTLSADEMTGFPLARVEAGRPLPLTSGLNPAWAGAIAHLRRSAVVPLFGADKTALSAEEWSILTGKLAAFENWQASRTAGAIDKLGVARIQEIATSTARAALASLIQQDKALEPEALAIADVERLARYYRDFGTLLRNFVNFTDFYDPTRLATFQVGTLYLDSRSCDLCIRVDDPGAHTVLASLSKCYIAYCDLKRVGGETMKIAACFTQGDSDFLMVGRNGLFYDRKGRDWDATITKIIDNPISIRQAFWAPYKKFVRMIEEQAAKRAAAAEAASDARLAAAATATVNADKNKPVEQKRIDVGSVAALGVALGALTTAFGYFLGFFKGLPWWQVPLVFIAVMLIISLPSMAVAWLKLRQRTLGPILDANGWAVNGRVKINIPFGTSLTERARLPRGSTHVLKDPFEDKDAARRRFIFIVVTLFAVLGYGYYAYRTKHWPFRESQPAPQQSPVPDSTEQKTG
jgi:hypothetical protein